MSMIKEILTRTTVSVVNSVISIYTRFETSAEELVELIEFFVNSVDITINDIFFEQGESGYTIDESNFSAHLNDQGELLVVDDEVDDYLIDEVGNLMRGYIISEPAPLEATNILVDGFTANWEAVPSATGYYLDVGLDDQFNKYIFGYQSLDIGNVLNYDITGLVPNTNYYFRIRAYDGTQVSPSSYPTMVTTIGLLRDLDGNEYSTVVIGLKEWTVENLKVTKYADGSSIPHITDGTLWFADSAGAYCWYDNNIANKDIYGALYNGYIAQFDNLGIRPVVYFERGGVHEEEWRIATDDDYSELVSYLGGSLVAGGKLKESGLTHWNSPNTGATNETGFTGLPGGTRRTPETGFIWLGQTGYFLNRNGKVSILLYNNESCNITTYNSHYGSSIRCVRDL